MADVGRDRHKIMSFYKFTVSPYAQVKAVPEGGFQNCRCKKMRNGYMLEETVTRLDLVNGLRIQPDTGPQQKWTVIAHADIHILRLDIRQQFGILAQCMPLKPAKRFLSLLQRPDIGCACGQDSQRGFGVDQSARHLTNCAVAADGEDCIIFFTGGLMRGLCGVSPA